MNTKNMRTRLCALLKECFVSAHVKQGDIAKLLGVSDSAISQMLVGKIVPNQAQIEKICEKVSVDRKKYLEITSLVSHIRSGFDELRSPFNHVLFAMRCQRGMSRRALSKASGIGNTRLRSLEHNCRAVPEAGEIKSLSAALCCPESELSGCLTDGIQEVNTIPPEHFSKSVPAMIMSVHDNTAEYSDGSSEILLPLEVFNDFSAKQDLFDFAGTKPHLTRTASSALPVRTVALQCTGKSLNLLWDGMVILHLTQDRPSGYFNVEFCRMKAGGYRLRELKGRTWRDFATRSRKRANEPILWSIPVLEFDFIPVREDAEEK